MYVIFVIYVSFYVFVVFYGSALAQTVVASGIVSG
jgi:hypothetical protein